MARSVFYYHLKRLKTRDKYADEKDMIKSIFNEHKGRYGYRRITSELRNRDTILNHKTVQRLMIQMGLNPSLIPDNYFQQFLGVFVGLTVCLSATAS